MKARLLKKLLNDTGYAVSNNDGYIAVGSPYVHNLISVDKETLKVKYALDTFHEGRAALDNKEKNNELLFIWDKLHELIASGEIRDIIEGKDELENPLPVFTVRDGVLVESVTDKYGWPNTDDDGWCMYENTHFSTKEEALKKGVREQIALVDMLKERIEDGRKKLEMEERSLEKRAVQLADLEEELAKTQKA